MSQSFLGKKYILKSSENFDAYLKELGVGLVLRKMGNTVKTECVLLLLDDGQYKFVLESPYRCSCITFHLNKEFKEITLDSREVKTICHLNGNVFVQEQSAPGLKPTIIVREYIGDVLITTLCVGNIKAVRVYIANAETKAENAEK